MKRAEASPAAHTRGRFRKESQKPQGKGYKGRRMRCGLPS